MSEVPKKKAVKDFFKYKLQSQLWKIVKEVNDKAEDDPDAALAAMTVGISNLRPNKRINSFVDEAQDRVDQYKEDRDKPLEGIIPPFPTWEKNIRVFENGTFHAIIGVSSSGKSWCAIQTALHAAFTQDKKVLLVSMENTTKSMQARMDALYHKLPFGYLKSMQLDARAVNRWDEAVWDVEQKKSDIWTVGATEVRSIHDIYQIATVKQPDLVIVDGAYKLASTDWNESSKLIVDFHNSAAYSNIPWIALVQLAPNANKLKGREAGMSARGNKSWFQAPETVLTITQSDDDRMMNRIRCENVKHRDGADKSGIDPEFYLEFNMNTMILKESRGYKDEEILNAVSYTHLTLPTIYSV